MATSGSFSGSIKDGKYTLRVDWSATQSTTNNTSKITAVMYLVQASGWPLNINSRSDNSTSIAGSSYAWSSSAINKSSGTTKLATVTSGNIAHNSDGTKSVTISATFYIRATISGTYYEKITASKTVTLDTIPRATTPTLSSTSVFMGSSVTISTPRASSSFTHDLAYQFAGGSWVSIATGVATSKAWTVPDLSTSIPNASSGAMTIRCITKNGSTTIGTKTVSMTAKVPTTAAYYPPAPTVTLAEAATEVGSHFGAFIQGKSKIKATIKASGAKGSTVSSITTTFLGSTYSGSSWTTGVVGSSGSPKMVVTVKDSRGRNTQITMAVTVLAYTKPQITLFNVYRVNESLEADDDGKYALVEYAYSVNTLNNLNIASAVIQYKPTTETEWQTLWEDSSLVVGGSSVETGVEFSTDLQYDFRITVTDYFGSQSTAPALLSSGDVILDILADGSGIGIGTTATLSGVCDIAMQTRLQGGTRYVLVPEGSDFNELRTPGRYVGDNLTTAEYKNSPFTSGTFDLDVIAAGAEGQVKQVATRCIKDRVQTLTRFYYSGSWGEWFSTFVNLPSGTDLNTLTTAGGYRLTAASTYTNAPEAGVCAMLEVLGVETLVQRWTTASKTDPRTYERHYYSGSWGAWICVSSFVGNILWDGSATSSGGWYMNDSQEIDLSATPVSAQPNGITLVFVHYNNGQAYNTAVQEFSLHKRSVALQSGGSRIFPLFSIGMDLFAVKTLYITNTKISGHANNTLASLVGSDGVTYQPNKFVLRYVLSY
ncbi:MAG: hypothetical protein J6B99_09745 [Oscillospiraceae bacterium]|nr:hypothetical protein [Oscillospiraceae bacterium]